MSQGGPELVGKVKESVSRSVLCDPMDYSPPVFSVHGILQARILEWVAISFSRDLPDPGIKPRSPVLAGRFFTAESPGELHTEMCHQTKGLTREADDA